MKFCLHTKCIVLIITENLIDCQLNSVAIKIVCMVCFLYMKRGNEMRERQGLIVYVHQLKNAKSLRKYGNVHYISRKLKYVVIYCNRDEIEFTMNKIKRLPFVKDVVESFRPYLKTEFENAKPDKAKEYDYDYKVGL